MTTPIERRGGPSQDELLVAFLTAPLPTLPRRRRVFQREEIDVGTTKVSFDQFVERYHNVAQAIDAGFGPKATLSPSAWVKTVADLTTRILYGVVATRVETPPTGPMERSPFKPEDQPTVNKIQENLDHLAKIFSLSSDSPTLMCDRCLHRTDQNRAQNRLSEADYTAILMATDRSRTTVMDRILSHVSADIHKEVSIWALDEGTRQRNTLRPKIREESKNFYVATSMKERAWLPLIYNLRFMLL
jgi:hypothetical protein